MATDTAACPWINQYGMKGVCAGHVQRTALVDGARIGAQNAILCWCNTTLGINLRVHGAHNLRYKYPSGARKSNIPYWWINCFLWIFLDKFCHEKVHGHPRTFPWTRDPPTNVLDGKNCEISTKILLRTFYLL